MKHHFCFSIGFVLLGFTFSTHRISAQFPVAIDVVYDFIKSNSIHHDKVDWENVDVQFYRSVAGAHSLKDTMDAFVVILKELDDVHSQFYVNNQYYGYWHANEGPDASRRTALVEQARVTTGKIECSLLEEQFAYVRVPGFEAYATEEIGQYAKMLRDSIDRMAQRRVRGFIIDLRLNMGGNMYPMLSGLGYLIGEGELAYEVDQSNTMVRTWKIHNGNFIMNDFPVTNLDSTAAQGLDEIPIAVLIGPVTASSGSMTAIAFKGRRNTVFIGEPTADGYTTSNGYFQFAPTFYMNFAVAYVADKNMNLYKTTVDPDILVVEGDDFEKLMEDQKIKRALLWLKGSTH